MELLFSALMGLGLSAACGFRVFIPPLVASVAAMTGHLTLAPGFAWLGTWPVLAALVVAACIEIVGYYLPFVGHFLDLLTTPVTVVAGTVLAASFTGHTDSYFSWVLAAIVGGGSAVAVKASFAAVRGVATVATAGLGTGIVSSLELAGAMLISCLAILAPVLAVLLVVALGALVARKLMKPAAKPRAKGKTNRKLAFAVPLQRRARADVRRRAGEG